VWALREQGKANAHKKGGEEGVKRGWVTRTESSPELRPWREGKLATAAFTSGEGKNKWCGEMERAAAAKHWPRAGMTALHGGELYSWQWRVGRAALLLLL
jgi:hypothetical protein